MDSTAATVNDLMIPQAQMKIFQNSTFLHHWVYLCIF